MCRMLGVMCNDADLLGCAIAEVAPALRLDPGQGHHGVGMGTYSDDEPLLKRRPSDPEEELDYVRLVDDAASTCLLVHVRRATIGTWSTKNTHPFRFRRWLFAHVGTLPALEPKSEQLLAELPPFLARNIRGETDSELAFHLYLHSLFRDGTINDLSLPPEQLAASLREFAGSLEELHAPRSQPDPSYAIIVTNGQIMGAVCRGQPMHYSHREGIHGCACQDQTDAQREAHAQFKGVMLGVRMNDPGHQWREVTDGSLLTVSRDLELKVSQI